MNTTYTNFVSNPQLSTFSKKGIPAFLTNFVFSITSSSFIPAPLISINAALAISASNSSQLLQSLTFSNSNDISFGLSNGVITASFSNTGGVGGVALSAGTQSASSG